jgi:hypothetical protein
MDDSRAEWVAVASLKADSFADPADFLALQESLRECLDHSSQLTYPFSKFGWFTELQCWIEKSIRSLGLHLTGVHSQFNANRSFSLVRFETNGSALWFKAVGNPNLSEFPITLALSRNFPSYIPATIESRAEWNGWLAFEAKGARLADSNDAGSWKIAAAELARLQIDSIVKAGILVEAGARELPAFALSRLARPFFFAMNEIMEMQVKTSPPALSRRDLLGLCSHIEDAASTLETLNLPNTLGHLDLNAGNIIVSGGNAVFLDWADAYVGNPFLSFQYLLENFRRSSVANGRAEIELTEAYSGHWKSVVASEKLGKALGLAPLLTVFASAAANDFWSDPSHVQNARFAAYLRSLTRRMNREAGEREKTMPFNVNRNWRSIPTF